MPKTPEQVIKTSAQCKIIATVFPEHSQPSTKSFAKIKGASVKQGYARQIRSAEIAEVQNYNLLHIYF
ncbi:hypothetical protein ACNKHP_23930 [Shigella boydii]